MLNIKLIEERFRREIEDIVIYEVQYYIKDSQVWENLCERFCHRCRYNVSNRVAQS